MTTSTLQALFNKPESRTVGTVPVLVSQFPFCQFDDAMMLGEVLQGMDMKTLTPAQLREFLGENSPSRALLLRVLAGCIALPPATPGEAPQQLRPEDVAAMPLVTVAEVLAVVIEVNADFFSQTLPRLAAAGSRAMSIGSALLNSLLAVVTTTKALADTPSTS